MLSTDSRLARGKPFPGLLTFMLAVALVAAPCGAASADQPAGKWGGAIDPDALQILKGMTDYLGSLQQFGMHTENTYEDVLGTGQKIQFGFSSSVVIQRPNKIRVERTDGGETRFFIYDGETLSIYDGEHDLFAEMAVPDNIDDFLFFARDYLDLVPPSGDMVFSNAFELLTASVTSGFVVGKTVIGGVNCYHLAFTTPVVDWQVWIADGDAPLPYKYVLTTMDDPAHPQAVTMISKWDTGPEIKNGTFDFEPPETAIEIDVVRTDAGVMSVY